MTQQISALTKQVENMMPVEKQVFACNTCGASHPEGDCVIFDEAVEQQCSYMGNFQKPPQQFQPRGNYPNQHNQNRGSYQGGQWRRNGQFQPLQQGEGSEGTSKPNAIELSLEKLTTHTSTFVQQTTHFMEETKANQKNTEASLKSLETQLGQLAKQVSERPVGRFPSSTEDPKSQGGCSAIFGNHVSSSFNFPCILGDCFVGHALLDTGSTYNVLSMSVCAKLQGHYELTPAGVELRLANQDTIKPVGMLVGVSVRIGGQVLFGDFMAIDMKNEDDLVILGTPLLAAGNFLLDVGGGKLIRPTDSYSVVDSAICMTAVDVVGNDGNLIIVHDDDDVFSDGMPDDLFDFLDVDSCWSPEDGANIDLM